MKQIILVFIYTSFTLGGTIMLTLIMIVCLSTVAAQGQYFSQSKPYDSKPLKVTNLQFFFHENFAGANPTTALVAQPNITRNDSNSSGSQFRFGDVSAVNDPLRVGPEEDSEVIGNAQGLGVISDKDGTIVVVYLDFGFTSVTFNGSSISIFSRNMIMETNRELAVVGGRGKFRMAKGFALLTVYSMNATTLIVNYNVTIVHYDDDN